MSARAVGAHLLRQMEREELLEACTLEAFERRFSALIVAELRTAKRNRYDVFGSRTREYDTRHRLWKQWLEQTERDIEARWDRRVAQWGDWWAARYSDINAFILDLLGKIERGESESFIQKAHEQALGEDVMRDLTIDVVLNVRLHEEWSRSGVAA